MSGGRLALFGAAALFVPAAILVLRRAPRPFGPANAVTTVRLALTAAAAGIALESPAASLAWWAVGAAVVAAGLDGVDGALARRRQMASPFGARFDMEVDALLVLVLAVLVWRFDKAGAWVLACGAMRYGFAAAGWVWPWLAGPLTPTLRGRAVAALQFMALAAALAPAVPAPASRLLAAAALALLTWSFALDVNRLRRSR